MKSFFQPLLRWLEKSDPRLLAGIAAGVLLLVGLLVWNHRRRRPSAEDIERGRRERLATIGRITDGHLVDIRVPAGDSTAVPDVLFYSYRLAGVIYNCAQDVSTMPDRVREYQLDQPLQVRYDPRNPGNSIVVAESWTGLWRA